MKYVVRSVETKISQSLRRGKSILLLGPRQTGKTTFLKKIKCDLSVSFASIKERQKYERDPALLVDEIEYLYEKKDRELLVFLDEVQKVPEILDPVQDLIDRKVAKFILTGSSARRLRRKYGEVNLLPGRVVVLRLDPFTQKEYPEKEIEKNLLFGTLPVIAATKTKSNKEIDLESYVETYLEEEVRSEALVRNVGTFSRFLECAAVESGNIVSFRNLSQIIGVSHTAISSYYEILEDCLIAERVDPYFKSKTRKKLTKSSKYLLFDLGVRRVCAREPDRLSQNHFGPLFEQFVGLELIRLARISSKKIKIYFWRDPDGPEVDWLIEKEGELIPVEVKWTERPQKKDARHLLTFLDEYSESKKGFILCRAERNFKVCPGVTAMSWTNISDLVR